MNHEEYIQISECVNHIFNNHEFKYTELNKRIEFIEKILLTKNDNNKYVMILNEYFLQCDFNNLEQHIIKTFKNLYSNNIPETKGDLLNRWFAYYSSSDILRNIIFNFVELNSNQKTRCSAETGGNFPCFIIDLHPIRNDVEQLIGQDNDYENNIWPIKLKKANKIILDKKNFILSLNITNEQQIYIINNAFPFYSSLSIENEIFRNILEQIFRLDDEYNIIKKIDIIDKNIINDVPEFKNKLSKINQSSEFAIIDSKIINGDENFSKIDEFNVNDTKYTIVETDQNTYENLLKNKNTEHYVNIGNRIILRQDLL